MEDLIREVLEYINPKVVTDAAAADKGKKAPPPKGKVEEAAPSDPYAGMDTKDYKEIGA
jgi:adenylate kinase family enzyme